MALFASAVGTTTSFYLLLSVVPLYASSSRMDEIGAGLATGVLMFSTVAAEIVTPALVARFGYRLVLAAGLMLLGAPALALTASRGLTAILVVCALRGLGFAMVVVVGSALVASLVPHERRAEGLGIYGVVVGAPGVAALPLGVWLGAHAGYPPVFVAGAVASLAGLALVPGLPGRLGVAGHSDLPPLPRAGLTEPQRALGILAGLRRPALVRPAIVFSATAVAAGVIVTFLPLAVTGPSSGGLAVAALLAQAAAATLARWWAGRHGDRHGSAGLLVPAVLATGIGLLALVMAANPVAVLTGMVLFGCGFGVAQNASLTHMFDRVPASGYGAVSAMWNLAYDAGLGLGGAGFGVVAAQTGYTTAFAVTAALVLSALAVAVRDRRALRANEDEVVNGS